MAYDYPISNFHFRVAFEIPSNMTAKFEKQDVRFSGGDIAFQAVSGLDIKIEMESIKEGGENHFEHKLPTRTSYSNLVLKRGVGIPVKSGLTDWCKKAFEQSIYLPLNMLVVLLDEKHEPLLHWNVQHAWPVNWKIGELNAEKGEVLIETIEICYNRFTFHGN